MVGHAGLSRHRFTRLLAWRCDAGSIDLFHTVQCLLQRLRSQSGDNPSACMKIREIAKYRECFCVILDTHFPANASTAFSQIKLKTCAETLAL